MNKFGMIGTLRTHKGKREELIGLLQQAAQLLATANGCHHYIIYKDMNDEDLTYVSEIWDSKEDHDAALRIDGCMDLITQAMPLLDGPPNGATLEVIGGRGIDG